MIDEREQAIRYMDVLARQLALGGKMDECAILHAASDLLERLFASADTRPQGGDSTEIEAPFTSGAVAKPDAQTMLSQTPIPSSRERK